MKSIRDYIESLDGARSIVPGYAEAHPEEVAELQTRLDSWDEGRRSRALVGVGFVGGRRRLVLVTACSPA